MLGGIIIIMRTNRPNLLAVLLTISLLWPMAAMAKSFGPPKATVSADLSTTALQPGQQAVVAVQLKLPAGFHAQSNQPLDPNLVKTDVVLEASPAAKSFAAQYPADEEHVDENKNKIRVYTGTPVIYIPIEVAADAKVGDVTLKGTVSYQACDDVTNQCYAPVDLAFEVPTKVIAAGEKASANKPELFKKFDPKAFTKLPAATQPATPKAVATTGPTTLVTSSRPPSTATLSVVPSTPRERNSDVPKTLFAAIWQAFLAGIIFNAMPCVLPVLPLKVLGFYEISQHKRGKTMLLAAAFSIGIVLAFLPLALLMFAFKHAVLHWGDQFKNPYFIWTIVVLLIGFAMSLFGMLTINLPMAAYRFNPRHDTISGNVLFGAFTVLLATPCTAPLFGPVLIWLASQTTTVAVLTMLVVGCGMASPYLVLSAFPGLARRFPRSGPWPELFKQMMGFVLLMSAAFFAAGRVLSPSVLWWPVVAVAAIGSLYLMARTVQLTKNASPVAVSAALAVLLLAIPLYFAMSSIGLGEETSSVGQPSLAGSNLTAASGQQSASWQPYSDEALTKARSEGRTVLVKFTANWCINCQVIDRTVFHNATALNALTEKNVILLRVDQTKSPAPGDDLLLTLNPAGGIPLTAIYAKGLKDPIVLFSLYTVGDLISALNDATRSNVVVAQ